MLLDLHLQTKIMRNFLMNLLKKFLFISLSEHADLTIKKKKIKVLLK